MQADIGPTVCKMGHECFLSFFFKYCVLRIFESREGEQREREREGAGSARATTAHCPTHTTIHLQLKHI